MLAIVSSSSLATSRLTYVYDESDYRIQLDIGGDTHTYKYDFADRITSRLLNSSTVESFSHDDDGNMIARTSGRVTTAYSWDSFDKLTSITKSSFSENYRYDYEGIRKSKGSDTRYFSSVASLVDLKTTNSTSFIRGEQLLGMRQGNSYYWYIPDALGTVRLTIDSSGNVSGSHASDEFGQQTAASGSVEKPHTYAGSLGVRNEWGSDSKLLYARQRWYDPSLGRWLSADPIGFAGGLSLYTYVENNPVNLVDPEGLIPPILIGLGIAVGIEIYHELSGYNDELAKRDRVCLDGKRVMSNGGVSDRSGLVAAFAPARGPVIVRAPRAVSNAIPVVGQYGSTTVQTLEGLSQAGGPTTQLITHLSRAPKANQGLSAATGAGACALASKASGAMEFVFNIPNALLNELERVGLATRSTTNFRGTVGSEIRFSPKAVEYILPHMERMP